MKITLHTLPLLATLSAAVCSGGGSAYGSTYRCISEYIDNEVSAASPAAAGTDSVPEKTNTLQEIVVEGETVVKKEKSIILYPTKRDKRFAAGGIDVLANMNIPEITVNPMTKEVTSTGGEAVKMFVDFQPADATQLGNLRPQDIERIDILYSPEDPRFQNARIAANYIMKKYEYGGYSKLTAKQAYRAYQGDYRLYSKFSYKRMTYDVWGGTDYYRSGNESLSERHTLYRLSSGLLQRDSRDETYKRLRVSPAASARAVYEKKGISIANTVGFNYTSASPSESSGVVDYSRIFESSRFSSSKTSHNRGLTWNGNYYFALPSNSSLSFNGNFSWGENRSNSSYTLSGQRPIINDISEDVIDAHGSVTYLRRIGDHSAGGYLAGGWNRNRLHYLSVGDEGVYYRDGYGSVRLFGDLNFNRVNISPSVTLVYSSEKVNGRNTVNWFPKAYVPFYIQLAKRQSLSGSFEFAKGAAEASMLSPVTLRENEIDAIRGNDALGQYDYYRATLGYSHYFGPWLRARLDATMTHKNNIVAPEYSEESAGEGTPMVVRNLINDGSTTLTSIRLNLSGEYFGKRLTVQLYGGADYYAQRSNIRRSEWAPAMFANVAWYVGSFRIFGYYELPTKSYSIWGEVKNPSYYFLGGAWSWNDLYVELRVNNPFRKSYMYSRRIYSCDLFSNEEITRYPSYHRGFSLTLSYSIGYGKKLNRNNEVGNMGGPGSIILK